MTTQGFSYGGQAVPEGVLMRGQRQATVVVRRRDGSLAYRHEQLSQAAPQGWRRVPLLRAWLALWESLNLGMAALSFAAQVAAGEAEQPLSRRQLQRMLLASLGILVGVVFVAPLLVGELAAALLPASWSVAAHIGLRELIEGGLRLALFVGYLGLLGRSSASQRLFGYHGAEHKAVQAYEAGLALRPSEVRRCSRIHPRCGTSFALLVMLLSILVFAPLAALPFWPRLFAHIVLLPLIAAVTYESVKLAAANYHRPWLRWLLAPLLALQRLTTREPDDAMIEVALAALLPVLEADGRIPALHAVPNRAAAAIRS